MTGTQQGPTNGAAKAAAATATSAPLTPDEQAAFDRLAAMAGGGLVNALAQRLAAAGLPVTEGGVVIQWSGLLLYRIPLVVGRKFSPRLLFDAVGGSTREAQAVAMQVLAGEAEVLARSIVPKTREWSGAVDGRVQAARKKQRRMGGAPDDVSGDATPTPDEPRRIILPGGG